MNAVKVKKVLYAFVHIVGPLSYLTISTIWGAFFTTKSTFENISDNLGVMAIYYSPFRTGKPIAFRHGMKVRLDTEYH
ncbi:hypothetical protein [Bacillus cereus]|uniref:hypothetical protein n=1 Tax=Bacillus cereus group TaxID=86661 RepID=UPI000E6AB4BA|nr:hypothetical protein [Bacillus cereus]